MVPLGVIGKVIGGGTEATHSGRVNVAIVETNVWAVSAITFKTGLGSNLRPCIYYALSKPTKICPRERTERFLKMEKGGDIYYIFNWTTCYLHARDLSMLIINNQ